MAGAAVMVTTAVPALASFVKVASGTQQVSTGTLAPPASPVAEDGPCQKGKSVSVRVTWTPSTSTFTTGYEVLRDGAVIGTVAGANASSFTDTTTTWSTAYAYSVRAVRNYWTSAAAAAPSFTTPGKSCR